MNDCLFCKIINKEISADILYEDKNVIAFNDINPKAPVHVLVIPKQHISSIISIEDADKEPVLAILNAIKIIAKQLKIDSSGFRTIVNCGKDAGQAVSHLHFHVLGGRPLLWPPG